MDRTAQRKAFEDLIKPTLDLQDASDAAADKAGATRNALPAATAAYNRAVQAFLSGAGTGAAIDEAKAALLKLQAEDPVNTTNAQVAYVEFTTSWAKLDAALKDLLQNPGAVEQV